MSKYQRILKHGCSVLSKTQTNTVLSASVIVTRTLHSTPPALQPIIPFKLSDIGEGIKEVEVLEWFVSEGDEVCQFDNLVEVQSDKAAVTITSRYDGVVTKLYHEEGGLAQVGQPLVDIDVTEEGEGQVAASEPVTQEVTPPEPAPSVVTPQQPTTPLSSNKALATPAVRGLAKQHGIDINTVQGSGKDGRVMMEDILNLADQSPSEVVTAPPSSQPIIAAPPATTQDTVVPMKGIKKAMFMSMSASLQIPHFGYDDEINMTEMVLLRKKLKKEVKHQFDVKLSYMPFIMKAASIGLLKYPELNAHLDAANQAMVHKASHNIGVAVDTPHGLLVPNVKNVQNLSIIEIARELNRLQEAGSKNKLSPDDLSGTTFSLSNIGSIGGTYAHPVIFPPQVAIGALGKIQVLPRFDRDMNVTAAHIMAVSWSADHRALDGATVSRFSNIMKDMLEEPERMILHLK